MLPTVLPGLDHNASAATPPIRAKAIAADQEAYLPPMLRPDWPGRTQGIDPGTLVEVAQFESKDPSKDEAEEEATRSYTVSQEELDLYAEELADRKTAGLPTYELEFCTEDQQSTHDSMFPEDAPLSDPSDKEDRMLTIVFGDAQTGKEYHHRIRASDLRAAAMLKHGGATEQSGEQAPVSDARRAREDEVLKAWSNSTDNRTRRGIADGYPHYDPVYQSLVDYGNCSGVVISTSTSTKDIYILTAAHCGFNPDGSLKKTPIYPRRDGSTKPYGSWIPANYWDWDQFKNRDCHKEWKFDRCASSDIMMIRAIPGPVAYYPHAFGYALKSKSELGNYDKYRRGYPSCNGAGAPSPCSDNTLYGDGALSIGGVHFEGSTGWHAVLEHSSDMNPRDSGSGMYYYNSDKKYVWGVNIAEDPNCYSNCPKSTPNYARRITPWWYNYISTNIP